MIQIMPQMRVVLMDQGSHQVEMSDEGLMTDDIEECLKVVIQALQKCDLPASELIAWCRDMLQKDRVGFICEKDLKSLRHDLEASRSK